MAVQLRGVVFVREGCLDCAQSKCDQCVIESTWPFGKVTISENKLMTTFKCNRCGLPYDGQTHYDTCPHLPRPTTEAPSYSINAADAGAQATDMPPHEMNLSLEALERLSEQRRALLDTVKSIERSLAVHCEQIAEAISRRQGLAEKADQLKRDIEWGRQLKRPPLVAAPKLGDTTIKY